MVSNPARLGVVGTLARRKHLHRLIVYVCPERARFWHLHHSRHELAVIHLLRFLLGRSLGSCSGLLCIRLRGLRGRFGVFRRRPGPGPGAWFWSFRRGAWFWSFRRGFLVSSLSERSISLGPLSPAPVPLAGVDALSLFLPLIGSISSSLMVGIDGIELAI